MSFFLTWASITGKRSRFEYLFLWWSLAVVNNIIKMLLTYSTGRYILVVPHFLFSPFAILHTHILAGCWPTGGLSVMASTFLVFFSIGFFVLDLLKISLFYLDLCAQWWRVNNKRGREREGKWGHWIYLEFSEK